MRTAWWTIGCVLGCVLAAGAGGALPPLGTEPAAPRPGGTAAGAASFGTLPEPAAPAAGPTFPHGGFVNADLVNIRCGPGLYYYPLLTLNKNTEVTVLGESGGWLALKPPPGVYGVMRRSDLVLGTDGKSATVSALSARIYASSASAKRNWCVMGALKQGDTLKVLGPADADMVRVEPPDGAKVYITSQYVAAGKVTATPSVGRTETPSATAAIAQMDVPQPKVDPLLDAYKKADAGLHREMAKPMEDRDLEPLLAQFKEIAAKAEWPTLRQYARDQAAQVQALVAQRNDYLKVVGLGDRLDQRLADLKARQAAAAAEAQRDVPGARPDFSAAGVVARMESLEGGNYPIKHKLVDQSGHPVVVLKSTVYNLDQYVGKVVGVRGARTFHTDWRIYLITVDEIEVLE